MLLGFELSIPHSLCRILNPAFLLLYSIYMKALNTVLCMPVEIIFLSEMRKSFALWQLALS